MHGSGVSQSPPKSGGDALAKRLLMNFREADRINKERCAEIHKVASHL